MKLNNPLDLLSLKLLGIGVEVSYERLAQTRTIVLHLTATFWAKEWTWQRKAS